MRKRTRGSLEMRPTARSVVLKAAGFLLTTTGGLLAQEHSVAVKGLVYDSATGVALLDVAIHVNQSVVPERTDSLGGFLLTGLSVGEYNLTLAKEGYAAEVVWFAVTETLRDTVDIGALPLGQLTEPITGAISGTILDSRTDLPVFASGVSVNDDLAAFSGDSGGFTTGIVDIEPGLNIVEFKRIGYEPFEFRLWAVRPHTDFDLEVRMDALPVNLDMVVVEADYTIVVFGALREFYRRRRTGVGHYLTPQDIAEQRPLLTSDMFRMIPGIVVRPGRWGGNRVETFGPRSMSKDCRSLNIFIDGNFVYTETSEELDGLVHPNEVSAIEVYPRPGQVPGRFKTTGSICGAIVIWTKWR